MFEVNFDQLSAEKGFDKHFVLRITPKSLQEIGVSKIKKKTTQSYIQARVSSLLSKKRSEIKSVERLEFGIIFNKITQLKPIENLSDYPNAIFSVINYPGYSNDLRPFNYVVLEGDISKDDIISFAESIIIEIKKNKNISSFHLKNIKPEALEKLIGVKFPENIALQITAESENDKFNKVKNTILSQHKKDTAVSSDVKFKFVVGNKGANLGIDDVNESNIDLNNNKDNFQLSDEHHTDDEDEKDSSSSGMAPAEEKAKVSVELAGQEKKNNQIQSSTATTESLLNNSINGSQTMSAISISNPLLNRSLQTIGTLLKTSQEEAAKLEKSQILQQKEINRCHDLIAEFTSKQQELQKQLKQAELKNDELEKENKSFKKIDSYKIGETTEISHQQFLDIVIEAESVRVRNQELITKNQSLENRCNELNNENISLKRKLSEFDVDLTNARNQITEFNTKHMESQNSHAWTSNTHESMQHPSHPAKYRKSSHEEKVPTAYYYSEPTTQFNNNTAQNQRRHSESTMQPHTAPHLPPPPISSNYNQYPFFNNSAGIQRAFRQISPLPTVSNEQSTYSISTGHSQPGSASHSEDNLMLGSSSQYKLNNG